MTDTAHYDEMWLSALKLLAPLVTKTDLRQLVEATTFDVQSPRDSRISLAYFRLRAASFNKPASIEVVMHPDWSTFHETEQLEAMCWVAVVAHVWFSAGLSWSDKAPYPVHEAFCKQIGAACSSSVLPSLRWYKLGLAGANYGRIQDYAAEHFESVWPNYCTLCKRPVHSDEPREDVHDNCLTYAKSVMIPSLKAQRAAEAAKDGE